VNFVCDERNQGQGAKRAAKECKRRARQPESIDRSLGELLTFLWRRQHRGAAAGIERARRPCRVCVCAVMTPTEAGMRANATPVPSRSVLWPISAHAHIKTIKQAAECAPQWRKKPYQFILRRRINIAALKAVPNRKIK
jgi:hypothetical protein